MTDDLHRANQHVVKSFLYGADVGAFADDGRLVNLLPDELPFGGVYEGPEGVQKYLDEIREALRIESLKIKDMVCDDERVVVIGSEQSRFLANGQAYEMDWVHVNTIRDGKIVEMREYNDTAAMIEAYRAPVAD